MLTIVGGNDPREAIGAAVCQFSILRRTSKPVRFIPLLEKPLRWAGLYRRQHEYRDGQLFDVISDAPMSTDFAITRFATPHLVRSGWALFCDFADMLFLADVAELFALADDRYAVMVVKHDHDPQEATKFFGSAQQPYPRKNWSSLILWNCDHPANRERLTLDLINSAPGRDLHRFGWLDDSEIGGLPTAWNHLVGVHPETTPVKALHFTLGAPFVPGYEAGPYADLWHAEHAILEGAQPRRPTEWPALEPA